MEDYLTIKLLNSTTSLVYEQGRRQKNFQWGTTEKTRPKNSTNKPPSTWSVAG